MYAIRSYYAHHHGAEQHRHRRGRSYRARHRKRHQVGAEQVEVFLQKREAHAMAQVRGIDHDEWAVGLRQVGKGRAVKDVFVIVPDCRFGAPGAVEHARRADHARDQRLLDVTP